MIRGRIGKHGIEIIRDGEKFTRDLVYKEFASVSSAHTYGSFLFSRKPQLLLRATWRSRGQNVVNLTADPGLKAFEKIRFLPDFIYGCARMRLANKSYELMN